MGHRQDWVLVVAILAVILTAALIGAVLAVLAVGAGAILCAVLAGTILGTVLAVIVIAVHLYSPPLRCYYWFCKGELCDFLFKKYIPLKEKGRGRSS